jgi:hypothetical protein
MTPNDYQASVLTTESKLGTLSISDSALRALMLTAAHAAGVVDQLKKVIFYGREPNWPVLMESAGSLRVSAMVLRSYLNDACEAQTFEHQGSDAGFDKEKLDKRLLHAALGAFGESGELIEALVNQAQGEDLDVLNFVEELGDGEWYPAIARDALGVSQECVQTMNVAKLTLVRYLKKQFTSEEATTRNKDLERKAMQFVLNRFKQEPGVDGKAVLNELAVMLGQQPPYPDITPEPNRTYEYARGGIIEANKLYFVGEHFIPMAAPKSPDVQVLQAHNADVGPDFDTDR